MKEDIKKLILSFQEELLSFAQDIIRIPSYTGSEGNVVRRIEKEMYRLGYDRVIVDDVGSVIGIIGNGGTKILFDSHIDTVEVKDPDEWTVDPFGGVIRDGKLYGRGASDMKSSAAASVYAGYAIKQSGLSEGKTIYVCCSAMEEDFDGEGLYHAIADNNLDPDFVVICEPTHLQISLGQRGRSIYKITTEGVSAHGSAPEKGVNAIYKMSTVLERIEALQNKFASLDGEKGSIAVSKIESSAVSLNAIPKLCSIYIDRRMTISEDESVVSMEMDNLVEGTGATWLVYEASGTSWRGEPITLRSFLPAWEISKDHKLTRAFIKTYKELYEKEPVMYKWDFSTNGVASAGRLGLPTIGFGAGIEKLAHMTDEYCPIEDIIGACEFYTTMPQYL